MKTRQERHRERVQKRQHREHAEQQHFSGPLTGKRARHIAGAEANLAYGDTMRQNAGLQRASAKQEQQVGDWYDTFANEIAASRGEVAGAYDKANTAIAGNMATSAADNTARNAALSAQDAQFAQLTGAPQNTSGPQTDAAAQGQRELYGAALAAPVAAAGANAYAYLTKEKNTARGEGIYQKVQERKRRQSLQQDRKALLKERGQYRATKLQELREGEQKAALERWKVNKAFPLEKEAAAADAADTAFDNRIAQREYERKLREGKEDGGGEGGDKKQGRQDAAATALTLYEKGRKGGKEWQSWAQLMDAVANEAEVGPADARRAVERLRKRVEREQREAGAGVYDPPGPKKAAW